MNFSTTTPAAMLSAWFMRRTALRGVRRVAQFDGALASDIGSVREENQDRVALVRGRDRLGQPFILAVLADGMGGMKSGSECAALTLGTFIDSVMTDAQLSMDASDEWLVRGAHRANKAVHKKYAGQGGSTLVAAVLMNGFSPRWLSVGDSRAYQAGKGVLNQLSLDDTLDGQLGKAGEGRRRDLLQFIGIGDALEPHIGTIGSDAETVLLTSDGVHFIDADLLAKVVHYAPNLGYCASRLTELAKMLGGPDNASVVALSFNALMVNIETYLNDVYEVWDPFGELQVMFDRRAYQSVSSPSQLQSSYNEVKPLANLPVAPKESTADKLVSGSKHKEVPSDEKGALTAKAPQKRSRGPRKKRNLSSESESIRKSEEAEELQLFIEFPNKKS